MLDTPVLFIIFNRLETTRKVFEAIRQVKPKQLFVAADGPRSEKEGEREKCEAVRKIIHNVDWDCEVKTLFRKQNIGCGRGPSEAITWFFENVEQGIILEDDCLPDKSFFLFCDELLKKYKNNSEVTIISGFNPVKTIDSLNEDYFFTRCGGIWGWGSWRRAWKAFNYDVPEWNNEELRRKVLSLLNSDPDRVDMIAHLEKINQLESVNFWDYQWWFYRILQNGIGILPKVNLIRNIGFGQNATHTFHGNSPIAFLRSEKISFPLKHPQKIEVNQNYELEFLKKYEILNNPGKELLRNRILNKIKLKLTFWKGARKRS